MTITGLDYKINKVNNGYVVEKSWMEKNDKDEFSTYGSEKNIFTDYSEVITFLAEAKF